MTFEEKLKEYEEQTAPLGTFAKSIAKEFWNAATYAANNRAGDASNEAEKDARLETAMIEINQLFKGYWNDEKVALETIIRKAQG